MSSRRLSEIRKALIAGSPLVLFVFQSLSEYLQDGNRLGGYSWWSLLWAVAQLAATYFPTNPWVKSVASFAAATAAVATAALTDNALTQAETFLVVTAALSWLVSSAVPNDRKDVPLALQRPPAVPAH